DIAPHGVLRADPTEHHVAVPRDDRHEVVEVVGDASGQLADRLHLQRLAELLLEMSALRDVHRHAAEEAPSGMVLHGKLEDQPVAKDPVWTWERFENFGRPVLGQYRPVVFAELARRYPCPEINLRV